MSLSSARLHELFAAAIVLDGPARAAMLDRACADDPALRREVEELLRLDASEDGRAEGGGLTQGGGSEWLAAGLASDSALEESPPPAQIGRFRIIREIGRGGMGIVYEAQQDDPSRRVAIKVIHPGMISRGLLRRFRQETRAMAQLRHPGIAQIYEAGTSVDESGGAVRPYFVMELVDGPTLLGFANSEALTIHARLELIARVCDALHHAHQKGVVHRDLKPENILVQSAGAGTSGMGASGTLADVQPKVLDFGVSRLAEEVDTGTLGTLSGQIVGTIPYLSPEQAAGESAVADIRSDVYSLGVVAYELLSGELPFDTRGRTVRAATRIMLEGSPRPLGETAPQLRGDVETIIRKAMERDPERRYPSAAEMAADIRRFLAHQPITARKPSAVYALRMFVLRNRAVTTVAVCSLALLVGALVVMSMLWVDARRSEENAVWQRYRSAVSAAGFALAKGDVGIARRQLDSTDPRFRGWEYRHFASRIDQSVSAVKAAAPGPFMLVPEAAGGSESLVLVKPESRPTLVRVRGERSEPETLDPRLAIWYAALGSRPTHNLLWPGPEFCTPDAATGKTITHHLPWPYAADRGLHCPRLSGDHGLMVAYRRGMPCSSILVIDLRDDRIRTIDLEAGVHPIRAAVSGDGTRVAVSTGFAQPELLVAQVFDTGTGRLISSVPHLPSEAHSLLLTRDGTRLYAAFHNGLIGEWDVSGPSGVRLGGVKYSFDGIENMTLSGDEKLLAAGTIDGVVRVFDAASLENTISLVGHVSEVHDVRFLPGDAGLISTGLDGVIRRWALGPAPQRPMVLRGHTHLVHALAIGSRGGFVATGSWDKTVRLFALESGKELASMPTGTFVQALALSPDERLLASREFGGDTRIFDVAGGTQVALLPAEAPSSPGSTVLDQPLFDGSSGRLLVRFDPNARTATFWNMARRDWETQPSEQISLVHGPTVCRTGAGTGLIARSEARDQQLHTVVYDFRSGREVLAVAARRPANESIAFSPDGRLAVAPGEDHHIQAYEIPSGRRIGEFAGHTQEVLAMVFSPDGSRLFSADLTGTIWVWDTRSREELTQLRGHEEHVRRLVISEDGMTLISGSRDGTARVWRADPP